MGWYYVAAAVFAGFVLAFIALDLWLLNRSDDSGEVTVDIRGQVVGSRWDDENPDDAMDRVMDR
jgi:hypothetical protein